ncbi:MAG: hypothetical protein HYV14_01665 [Elusimicrobia bacterium]|nr:hypothetical protein [Elusimicrobiota bacterium]
MNSERIRRLAVRTALGLSLVAASWTGFVRPPFARAASVCTVVKLELEQKAALEREAFNAHLVLTNNQADTPLSSLRVTISIKDSLGNPADALFFNKVTDIAGVSAVDGTGTMQPAAVADIRWLIIPSPGAGGSQYDGTQYQVTAQISYVSGETPGLNPTQPAYITVYPQPLLSLEYLMPFEVFGVDPFTLTGSTEPFPLGLRVSNVGAGTAVNFQIDSAQPGITDNKQGLPISFQIVGAFLNSSPLPANTLTVPFGNIPPGGSSLASWQMTSSFSGRFTDFTVTATHDASLGGALTSLIQSVTTYTLIKDVLDDQPGRDAQYDLLVNVGTPRSRMESDYQSGLEPKPDALIDSDRPGFTPVRNVPAHLGGGLSGSNGVLNVVFDQAVPTGTWVHTSIPFPQGDSVPLTSVSRSDGKPINPRNAWIAKHIDKLTNTRTYFLHLLDFTSSEPVGYAMTFNAASLIVPPDPISNLSALASGPGALSLSWNATGAEGSSGTIVGGRYAIFASTDPSAVPGVAGAAVSFSTVTQALAGQDYLLSGLLGNATYQIAVFLANAAGQFSSVSNMVVVQTLANPPTAVQVTSITASGFALSWTTSANGAGTEYQVALSSGEQTAFTADQSSAVFSGLNANQTYSVTSVERNGAQALTPAVVIAGVTTLALPPATTSPAFVSITTDSAQAQWLLDGNPTDTEFFSELSTSASRAPVFAASGWVRAHDFTFAGLPSGTTFYGQVKARNRALTETAYADLGAMRTAPVDNLPPLTSLAVGLPQFGASPVYIATGTILSLSAVDDKAVEGDGIGLGVAQTLFAIDSSSFTAYTGTFTLVAQGTHTIQFYSVDVLGNAEIARSALVAVAAPPAAVVDLALAAVHPSSVTLRWTEPVGAIPQVSYDLRRATFPITTDNFDAATAIPAPAPASSGTVLSIDVAGVTEPGFYAALVSRNALGGVSPLSNVAGLIRSTVTVNGYPELAFSANQSVTATLLSPAEGKGAVAFASAAPVGLILVSSIYDLGPEGAVFNPYAALTLRYSAATLAALGLVPSDLAIYQYVAGSGWVAVSAQTLSVDDQNVIATIPSLASIFALLGKSHVPPTLALTPINGSTVTTPTPRITAVYSAIGPGVAPATVRLTLDGADATASAVVTASEASFTPDAALAQGSHTVTAAVADYAGNVATASSTFFLDSVPPETTLVVGDPLFSSTTLFVTAATPLGLTASEPARTFYAVGSSTFAAYSGTFTLVALGTYTVQFYSVDLAGNVEATRSAQAAVDGLPPRTAAAFGEPKFAGDRLYVSSTTPIEFSAADDLASLGDGSGAGAAQTLLSVDSAAFAAAVSAISLSSEGEHALSWYSRDLLGNSEIPVSTSIVVDLTPPLTQLLISSPSITQASGTVVGPATILSLSAQDPVSGGVASGVKDTFLSVSTNVFAPAPVTFTLFGADGPRTVSFYSRDNVLNAEPLASATVLLDATPPVSAATIAVPLYVAADGTRYVTPATPISFSAQDAAVDGVASGVGRIEVSVDGAAFAVYAAGLTFAEGRHVVRYRAVDNVGNVEAERELLLRSDATPPLTVFAPSGTFFTAADGARFAPLSFSYSLPAADPVVGDVASGLAFTRYALDSGSFQAYATTFTLTEGVRRVDFQSEDNLGHLELLQSATVFVDAAAPLTALAIGAPQFISSGTVYVSTATPFSLNSQDPTVAGTASGVSGISFRLDAAAFGPYLSVFTLPAPDGLRNVAWSAADNVGNVEAEKTSSVALDATAPQSSLVVVGGRQVAGPDAASFYASSDTRVAFMSFDPVTSGVASGLAAVRYQDNGGAFQNFAAPPALGEGRHALGYQAQDNVLNLEVLRSTTVLVDATPPVTAISMGAPTFTAADGTVYVAPASSISFSAADPSLPSGEPGSGAERVEVSVDAGVYAAFNAPLTFSEGLHTVRYRALDRVGNVSAERTLELRSDATPPASELAIGEPSFSLSSATVLVSSMTPLSIAAQDPTVNAVASGVKETFYRFVDVMPSTAPFLVYTASFTFTGADGAGTVEFYSRDQVLNTEPVRSRALLLDSTRPVAVIDSPHGGQGICSVVKGIIPVRGTARDLHFASYLLESAPGRDAAAGFVAASSGTAAVDAGLLGTWDARSLSGWQTLRLTVLDQVRNASVATLSVFVGDPGRLLVLGSHETFNMPQGVAAGADGRIYVAETNDDQVQVFSATGTALVSFGRGHGRDNDEDAGLRLNKPKSVAVDAAGAIFIADTHNDRILKLSATGQVLLEVGRRKPGRKDDDKDGKDKGKNESQEFQSGKGPGEFRKPSGVAVDGEGNIFVADTDNNRVQKLGPDGAPLLAFDLPPASGDGEDEDRDCERPELGRPVGIALDGAGNIYVADPRGARALKFSPAGQLLMTLPIHSEGEGGRGKPGRPEGVAVSPDGSCVLVSDQRSSRVIKFDAAGVQTLAFGEPGKIKDNKPLPKRLVLRKPAGLALDAGGKLYVADRNNDRIQVFGLSTGEPALVVPPPAHDHNDEHVAREVVDREEGGSVERDDQAGVNIPAGALAEDLKITVSTPSVSVEGDRDRNRDEQNLKVVSAPVEYGPEGTKFKEPVTLILPYTPDLIAAQGVAEDSLKIHYWNKGKGEWEALESEVDKKNGTIKAKTPHFSLYQVLGSTGPGTAAAPLAADASFGFKDLYAFPNPVRGQGPVTIRIQPGLADSITVRVYDVSGRKVHESSNFVNRGAFDDGNGKGPQYTYDHIWDVSGVGSGVYTFVVTATKSGERDIHKTGKVGLIK